MAVGEVLPMHEIYPPPQQAVEFLARYFTLNALLSAKREAFNRGDTRAEEVFKLAVDRTTWVGGPKL